MAAKAAMASTAPDNAEQLRRRANRRLLGASILLLIAIITVPMFLEREPPPLPDNVDVRIPPVEGTKFDPKFPTAADAKKAAAEKPAEIAAITEPTGAQATVGAIAPTPAPATPKPAAPVVAAKPAAVAPVAPPKAAEKAPAKPAEPAAPKDSTPADRKPGQLVVQVIAVRDAAVAKQTYDKAKSLKFPVYTEKIDVANGIVIRVRVGPFNTKQQAESARAKLAQSGLEAKVLTLQ
ncbi:MAG: SPOR domain-containing protein [Casimicrobium sp.]